MPRSTEVTQREDTEEEFAHDSDEDIGVTTTITTTLVRIMKSLP